MPGTTPCRWPVCWRRARQLRCVFFFFKQKTAYEIFTRLEFRRVLFRSLAAPFHPYPKRGGMFSVALSFESPRPDRKSTRLNSSHVKISYAVFCLQKNTPSEYIGPIMKLCMDRRGIYKNTTYITTNRVVFFLMMR